MSIFTQIFGGGFDTSSVEPSQDFELLPPGKYSICLQKAEVKPTKKGDGHYLEVMCQVLDGPHAKRLLWSRMNIDNPSEAAQRIGQSQLSGLCRACGIGVLNNENDLLGKTCIASVRVKDEQNEIRSWHAIPTAGTLPTSVAPPSAPPTTPTQPAQSSAPAAANRPPWAR